MKYMRNKHTKAVFPYNEAHLEASPHLEFVDERDIISEGETGIEVIEEEPVIVDDEIKQYVSTMTRDDLVLMARENKITVSRSVRNGPIAAFRDAVAYELCSKG